MMQNLQKFVDFTRLKSLKKKKNKKRKNRNKLNYNITDCNSFKLKSGFLNKTAYDTGTMRVYLAVPLKCLYQVK